jgi:mannitol-1-/sugar-/sorbitol-6-/2-deoxyglucose-6-phosphatase
MPVTTVIFDMDGLLIDSEPYWEEAGKETLAQLGVTLTPEQYHITTGLRTSEWINYWFHHFNISQTHAANAEAVIVKKAIDKIALKGTVMPGVDHIFNYFIKRQYKIGLASSSPMGLIDVVVDKLQIRPYLHTITSAEHLPFGKPHPQVFIDCATALNSNPQACLVFEDSFNGMIAAKAAKMKCVVVPHPASFNHPRWGAADLKLSSLANFNDLLLNF